MIQRYCALRGIERVENWTFYLAFSFFRLASICQGIYKRVLDGNASNEKAMETGKLTNNLAEIAVTLIEQEG